MLNAMVTFLLATTLLAAAGETPGSPPPQAPARLDDARSARDVGRGVSETLAAERTAAIQNPRYDLRFIVPVERREAVLGRLVARLALKAPHRIVFDFAQPPDRVRTVTINGRDLRPELADGHIARSGLRPRRGIALRDLGPGPSAVLAEAIYV